MERTVVDSNGEVSLIDFGGEGPLVVCVHGLEGSAFNWNLIGPELAHNHRVVAPDLSGFAHTPPLERGSTVEANREVVADVIKHFGDEAILIGNSMGGLISLLVAEEHPNLVRGLVLVDPAAPVSNWFTVRPHAAARLSTPLIPGVAGHLIDLYRNTQTPEQAVDEALEFVAEHPERLSPIVRRDALEIAELRRSHEWSTPVLIEAVRSIAPYVVRKAPFARMLHRIGQPTLLVHGTEDALIQIETARWMARQRPDWTHAFFEGVGHVPMLEVPDALLEVFTTWEAAVFGEDASVGAEKP